MKTYGLGSNHCYGGKNKTAKKYGMKIEKISTVMNQGVNIRFKAVTPNLFTVVGLLVELGTAIVKSQGSIEVSTTIM